MLDCGDTSLGDIVMLCMLLLRLTGNECTVAPFKLIFHFVVIFGLAENLFRLGVGHDA